NGWKGQLLRSLYYETEPLVAGGHTFMERSQRIAVAKDAVRAALLAMGWADGDIGAFKERHFPDYWLRTDTAHQVEHAVIARRAEQSG
ncbi:hypothetical protein ACJENI_24630, partial [Escherichia coli]